MSWNAPFGGSFRHIVYLKESFDSDWKKILSNTKSSGSRAAFMTESRKGRMPVHEITFKDLKSQYNRQNGLCYWSGVPMRLDYQKINYHPLALSVDRLDNDKGYVRDNFVICLRLINLGKNQYSSEEFPKVVTQLKRDLGVGWWCLWR